jgi:hypothetical protein
MTTQIVEPEAAAAPVRDATVALPEPKVAVSDATLVLVDARQGDLDRDPERPMAAVRGIIVAVFISIPFWLVIGFAVYLLM